MINNPELLIKDAHRQPLHDSHCKHNFPLKLIFNTAIHY
jgi:hypothetical protein